MKPRLLTLSLLCLLFYSSAPAQTDSLKKLLAKATHDTTRCALLNQLIEQENNDGIWPTYNQELMQIAQKHLHEAGSLKNVYLKYQATGINNLGYIANMRGNYDKAIEYYEQSLAIQRQISNTQGVAAVLYNLGDMYALRGNLHQALEYLHESLKLHEQLKDETGTAYVLNDLGWYYHVQGDDPNALLYLGKARDLREKLADTRGLANTYNNLGLICLEKHKLDDAHNYFSRAFDLMQKSGDKRGEALALNSLGAIYCNRKNYKPAIDHYQQAARIQEEMQDRGGWLTSMNNIADAMLQSAHGNKGKLQEALKLATMCMEGSRTMGPNEVKTAAGSLQRIYVELGDYKKAYEYYGVYIRMRDSVINQETRKAAMKKQFQYQYEKKTAADSVKHAEAQKVKDAQLAASNASLKQERTQRYALYGGLALVLVFLFVMFNRFRVTQRQKSIIEEQKRRVDQAYESLHEKNKEVMDSIYYARRIQKALITSEKYVHRQLERLMK